MLLRKCRHQAARGMKSKLCKETDASIRWIHKEAVDHKQELIPQSRSTTAAGGCNREGAHL
jgi:hypothetical protein